MLFFIKLIIGFIINSLISPEERDVNHPHFNPLKIVLISFLVVNLLVSIHLVRRNALLYDFLTMEHPELLEEFRVYEPNREKNKITDHLVVKD